MRDSQKVNVSCFIANKGLWTVLFFWKHGYWGNVSRDAAKLASSSNEWRFRRLHFPTGRSSTRLAPGCSMFSEWISTSTMDRSRQERRPGAPVLAPEISWPHTLRLFLMGGFVNEAVYVPSLPTTLDDLKKPYHKCGELSDARHSSSGVERIQLPSRCYPCGRRWAHWTFINFTVSIIKCNLHYICH